MRGRCEASDQCRHAHGVGELRTLPPAPVSTSSGGDAQSYEASSPRLYESSGGGAFHALQSRLEGSHGSQMTSAFSSQKPQQRRVTADAAGWKNHSKESKLQGRSPAADQSYGATFNLDGSSADQLRIRENERSGDGISASQSGSSLANIKGKKPDGSKKGDQNAVVGDSHPSEDNSNVNYRAGEKRGSERHGELPDYLKANSRHNMSTELNGYNDTILSENKASEKQNMEVKSSTNANNFPLANGLFDPRKSWADASPNEQFANAAQQAAAALYQKPDLRVTLLDQLLAAQLQLSSSVAMGAQGQRQNVVSAGMTSSHPDPLALSQLLQISALSAALAKLGLPGGGTESIPNRLDHSFVSNDNNLARLNWMNAGSPADEISFPYNFSDIASSYWPHSRGNNSAAKITDTNTSDDDTHVSLVSNMAPCVAKDIDCDGAGDLTILHNRQRLSKPSDSSSREIEGNNVQRESKSVIATDVASVSTPSILSPPGFLSSASVLTTTPGCPDGSISFSAEKMRQDNSDSVTSPEIVCSPFSIPKQILREQPSPGTSERRSETLSSVSSMKREGRGTTPGENELSDITHWQSQHCRSACHSPLTPYADENYDLSQSLNPLLVSESSTCGIPSARRHDMRDSTYPTLNEPKPRSCNLQSPMTTVLCPRNFTDMQPASDRPSTKNSQGRCFTSTPYYDAKTEATDKLTSCGRWSSNGTYWDSQSDADGSASSPFDTSCVLNYMDRDALHASGRKPDSDLQTCIANRMVSAMSPLTVPDNNNYSRATSTACPFSQQNQNADNGPQQRDRMGVAAATSTQKHYFCSENESKDDYVSASAVMGDSLEVRGRSFPDVENKQLVGDSGGNHNDADALKVNTDAITNEILMKMFSEKGNVSVAGTATHDLDCQTGRSFGISATHDILDEESVTSATGRNLHFDGEKEGNTARAEHRPVSFSNRFVQGAALHRHIPLTDGSQQSQQTNMRSSNEAAFADHQQQRHQLAEASRLPETSNTTTELKAEENNSCSRDVVSTPQTAANVESLHSQFFRSESVDQEKNTFSCLPKSEFTSVNAVDSETLTSIKNNRHSNCDFLNTLIRLLMDSPNSETTHASDLKQSVNCADVLTLPPHSESTAESNSHEVLEGNFAVAEDSFKQVFASVPLKHSVILSQLGSQISAESQATDVFSLPTTASNTPNFSSFDPSSNLSSDSGHTSQDYLNGCSLSLGALPSHDGSSSFAGLGEQDPSATGSNPFLPPAADYRLNDFTGWKVNSTDASECQVAEPFNYFQPRPVSLWSANPHHFYTPLPNINEPSKGISKAMSFSPSFTSDGSLFDKLSMATSGAADMTSHLSQVASSADRAPPQLCRQYSSLGYYHSLNSISASVANGATLEEIKSVYPSASQLTSSSFTSFLPNSSPIQTCGTQNQADYDTKLKLFGSPSISPLVDTHAVDDVHCAEDKRHNLFNDYPAASTPNAGLSRAYDYPNCFNSSPPTNHASSSEQTKSMTNKNGSYRGAEYCPFGGNHHPVPAPWFPVSSQESPTNQTPTTFQVLQQLGKQTATSDPLSASSSPAIRFFGDGHSVLHPTKESWRMASQPNFRGSLSYGLNLSNDDPITSFLKEAVPPLTTTSTAFTDNYNPLEMNSNHSQYEFGAKHPEFRTFNDAVHSQLADKLSLGWPPASGFRLAQ